MLAETNILDRLATSATIAEKHLYYGVSWNAYLSLLDDLGNHRPGGIRLAYIDGILEIMSPKRLHEQVTRLVDMILTLVTFELGMNLDNCGAMTLRVDLQEKGGEPDSCFYVANESKVRGVAEIDLQVHPPPDVVLEVDITSPSLDKMKLYAVAGVPEVWRFDGAQMRFFVLRGDQEYQSSTHSRNFSHLSAERLTELIRIGREHGSTAMLQAVKSDVQSRQ